MERIEEYVLEWRGPLAWWSGSRITLYDHPDSARPGLYLQTFEHSDGFLIYSAGLTTRPFSERFLEHTKEYLAGVYTVLDAQKACSGERVELWPGIWYGQNPWPRVAEFLTRYRELAPHIVELLSAFSIFIAPLDADSRVFARIEAAIMGILYSTSGPVGALPDHGMHLSPRWPKEKPFRVRSLAGVHFQGLPEEFEA